MDLGINGGFLFFISGGASMSGTFRIRKGLWHPMSPKVLYTSFKEDHLKIGIQCKAGTKDMGEGE